jgi:hypothetical protein
VDTRTLRLEEKDFEIFSDLKQKLDQVGLAARRKGVKNVVMNEDEGSGSGDEP